MSLRVHCFFKANKNLLFWTQKAEKLFILLQKKIDVFTFYTLEENIKFVERKISLCF